MKRTLLAALAALMLVGLMISCGGDGEEEAEAAEPDHRIGIVFDVGGRGDNSFNDSAYRGLVMLAEEYEGFIQDDPDDVDYGSNIQMKYLEPQGTGQDREQLLRVLAEDGYGLIFGVGFAFADSMGKVAADFPDTEFGIIDAVVDAPNVTGITFAEHEGSFLVGALAGLYTADNSPGSPLGYIGGMDIPLIHKFHGGYFAGRDVREREPARRRDAARAVHRSGPHGVPGSADRGEHRYEHVRSRGVHHLPRRRRVG